MQFRVGMKVQIQGTLRTRPSIWDRFRGYQGVIVAGRLADQLCNEHYHVRLHSGWVLLCPPNRLLEVP